MRVGAICVTIALAGVSCAAKQKSVLFVPVNDQEEVFLKLPAMTVPHLDMMSPEAGFTPLEPVPNTNLARADLLGRKYVAINSLHVGLAALDTILTHRAIVTHNGREANPMLPSSLGGQLGANLATCSYAAWISYRMKKHHSPRWWVQPVVGSASHGFGAATGLAHQ